MPLRPALCTAAILLSTSAAADTDWIEVDRVAIVVDHDIILASEVELELSRNPDVLQAPDAAAKAAKRDQLRPQVVDQLIERSLFVQKASTSYVTVDDADVDLAIEEIKKQNQLDDEGLNAALVAQNWTLPQYRVELRYQLLRLRAINQLIRPKIVVRDDQVRAEYDRLVKDAGTEIRSFDEAKADVRNKLVTEALDAETAKEVAAWRAATYVDVRLP